MNVDAPKPHVFVGSSSEQLPWARAIQSELDFDAEVTVWPQGVFRPSQADLQSLLAEARRSDFAIFIFAPDDVLRLRDEVHPAVRDNVIFELGMFVAELGRERCFLVAPRGSSMHLPTDIIGMTPLSFEMKRNDENRQAALGYACNQIREQIGRLGPRTRSPFADHESAHIAASLAHHAREASLEHVYPSRADALPDIAAAIACGGRRVRLLSNKGDDWLGPDGAVSKTLDRLRGNGTRFELRTVLLHPESPWLEDGGAGLRFLGKTRQEAVEEMAAAHHAVELWCSERKCLAPRYHRHHPAWRFIQTEAALFISTYVTNEQIAAEPVLRFGPLSPIYRSVTRYFDFLYENYSAPRAELSRYERVHDKPVTLEASAGIVVTRGIGTAREVLLVERSTGALALPKGHIEAGETPVEAATRELFEEAGATANQDELRYLGMRPAAYVLPNELVMKALLYFQLDVSIQFQIDSVKARWVRIDDLDSVALVDDYICEMLRAI